MRVAVLRRTAEITLRERERERERDCSLVIMLHVEVCEVSYMRIEV